jgi:hypothetical protein
LFICEKRFIDLWRSAYQLRYLRTRREKVRTVHLLTFSLRRAALGLPLGSAPLSPSAPFMNDLPRPLSDDLGEDSARPFDKRLKDDA